MTVDETVEALVASGAFRFAGPAPIDTIKTVEQMLGVKFPAAYTIWLLRYGGGGAPGAEISGLYPTGDIRDRGTVLGDTERFRYAGLIPDGMVVVLADESDHPLCLSTVPGPDGLYPVVTSDGTKLKTMYADFDGFFTDYVVAWAQDSGSALRKQRPV